MQVSRRRWRSAASIVLRGASWFFRRRAATVRALTRAFARGAFATTSSIFFARSAACADLSKTIRIYMERDPIILFSCTIGLFGARAPHKTRGRSGEIRKCWGCIRPTVSTCCMFPCPQALLLPLSSVTVAAPRRRHRRPTLTASSSCTRVRSRTARHYYCRAVGRCRLCCDPSRAQETAPRSLSLRGARRVAAHTRDP